MVHSGFEATAVNDTVAHPLKAMKVALKGVRTTGPMAPELSIENQRPAEYVFAKHVEIKLEDIKRQRKEAKEAAAALAE
jgi:hypothetical protein